MKKKKKRRLIHKRLIVNGDIDKKNKIALLLKMT